MRFTLLSIAIAGILSVLFRVVIPYNDIFKPEYIVFQGVDCYYYLRIADITLANWPPDIQQLQNIQFDMYRYFPDGSYIPFQPVWVWILCGVSKVLSVRIDLVAAWLPAVLGVLIIVPVYFISKGIFSNKWIAAIGTGLVAIMPGELLVRTMLGSADHHAAEVLLLLSTIALTIYAIKYRWWLSIFAGILLGLYLLIWIGGSMLMLLLVIVATVQLVIDTVKKQKPSNIYTVVVIILTIGTAIALLADSGKRVADLIITGRNIPIVAALLYSYTIAVIAHLGNKCKIIGLCTGCIAIVATIAITTTTKHDDLLNIATTIGRTYIWDTSNVIGEGAPLFISSSIFTLGAMWGYFNTTIFFFMIGLGMFWRQMVKGYGIEKLLFFIWCIMLLLNTLAMRRFAYYLEIPAAIMTAYVLWSILRITKARQGMVLVAIVFVLGVVAPCVTSSVQAVKSAQGNMTDGWHEALMWLKDKTPSVENDKVGYYKYQYCYNNDCPLEPIPNNAYGVLSINDYGYWISREAQRPSIVDPASATSPEAVMAAQTLISTDNPLEWQRIKYIVVDYLMATVKFYAIAQTAGLDDTEYVQWQISGGDVSMIYSEKYYKTLLARLWYEQYDHSVYTKVFESSNTVEVDGKTAPEVKIFQFR